MNVRALLHHYVPANFNDPLGLAGRLLRSRDPAAMFAMASALAGAGATPLDVLLWPLERRMLRAGREPKHPLIIVCGPPRSGTTIVHQTLVSHLPVAYFSNLVSLFPRSPLAIQRLAGRFLKKPATQERSFYGRTAGLAGTSDALHLWDRWMGADRTVAPDALSAECRQGMAQFFAACDAQFDKPLVCKNNSLSVSAHLVAEALPHARFICLTRRRRELAQSLYRARCEIHGDPGTAYGLFPIGKADGRTSKTQDAIQSVCRQATLLEQIGVRQAERIGPQRFWIVEYEAFCRRPGDLVRRVAADILGDAALVCGAPPSSLRPSSAERVTAQVAARIDAELAASQDFQPAIA